jgi:hypothetical protein
MHTSAHPPGSTLAEYTGTLLHSAQVRAAVLDGDGHSVPVLCLDVELDNALHTLMHVEQPFPPGHHAQAQAAAHRYKKGTRVTVQAPLVGLRLVAANASHIHPLDTTTETPQPCQQSSLL